MSESEAWSEADCLAYDPFAGDDYGNDFVDFGAKIVNGRKVYQCHICQGPIAKGERHRVDSCILDGERLHARFCGICCAAMAISSEDGGEAITAREPEFQPPLLDDPLMTTPDLEALAREHEELHAALEPAALPMASHAIGATLSIAISLKRIADALHGDDQNTGMKHALAEIAHRAYQGWGPSS